MTARLFLGACLVAWSACACAFLDVDLGDTGVRQVTVDGVRMLAPGAGDIRVFGKTPRIAKPDGTVAVPDDKPTVSVPRAGRVVRTYSWGVVDCEYSVRESALVVSIAVTNASRANTIAALDLSLVELMFGSMPEGRSPDAGMFATGGKWQTLGAMPLASDPTQMPPLLFVRSEAGLIIFASEIQDGTAGPSIPFATSLSKLTYPFIASFAAIPPQGVAKARLAIRFGAVEDEPYLASDVYDRFRDAYPYDVVWPDRRPIGALFLATSQAHPSKNPRGWFQNAQDVDTTTPQGLAKWRERLMRYADGAIRTLRELGAQGMITWDPEGEQFGNAVYYGDPRLAPQVAPETDYDGALDEYFRRFRDAGFATGITIRPQAVRFDESGIPRQRRADNPRDEMLAKIEYARARWGCTLFYVDSSYDGPKAIDAEVFRQIHEKHPDILLMPENEVFRHFAYSAPLNSFDHMKITSTPFTVRQVYDQAFSTLLATVSNEEQMNTYREALTDAVRNGDVLIVNAWYGGKHIDYVRSLYRDAGR